MDDWQLREIESAAVEFAHGAGQILLDHFRKPLQVEFKGRDNRNPVTDADYAADAYLRESISRRFPDHAIISEETGSTEASSDFVWIIDPLDGTTNYLHGLPVFGVIITVVECDKPAAAAIFIPPIREPKGVVVHASAGGGAYLEEERLDLRGGPAPEADRMLGAVPAAFLRMFRFNRAVRRRLGDTRTFGSTAYESAMAAQGVFEYLVFNNSRIWDVAAGVLLVQEAGGAVMCKQGRGAKAWLPFERFAVDGAGEPPTAAQLREWRGSLIMGAPQAVPFIANGATHRRYRVRRAWMRLKERLSKRTKAQEAPPPASATRERA